MFMQKFNNSNRKNLARILTLLLVLAFSITAANAQKAGNANRTTIVNAARILDVKSGKYLNDYAVLIVNGRIQKIASRNELARAATKDANIVNLPNATLLPGLIDVHTHLLDERRAALEFYENNIVRILQRAETERMSLGERAAREMIESGWTTVRDLGDATNCDDLKLRDRINAGQIVGPRMLVSCKKLTPPGGQHIRPTSEITQQIAQREYFEIRTADDARRAVAEDKRLGADVIKVIVDDDMKVIGLEEMRAIVEAAHGAKLKVAAHAHILASVRVAVEAGADSVEHAYEISDELLQKMRERKIYLVPTDITEAAVDDLLAKSLPPNGELRPEIKKYREELVEKAPERLKRAITAKVLLAAGSDTAWEWSGKTRGEQSDLVFDAYRKAGMSPLEIIRAATLNAADLLGLSESVGSIDANKFADLIAVEGDPLANFAALKRVVFVMKNGEILKNR